MDRLLFGDVIEDSLEDLPCGDADGDVGSLLEDESLVLPTAFGGTSVRVADGQLDLAAEDATVLVEFVDCDLRTPDVRAAGRIAVRAGCENADGDRLRIVAPDNRSVGVETARERETGRPTRRRLEN